VHGIGITQEEGRNRPRSRPSNVRPSTGGLGGFEGMAGRQTNVAFAMKVPENLLASTPLGSSDMSAGLRSSSIWHSLMRCTLNRDKTRDNGLGIEVRADAVLCLVLDRSTSGPTSSDLVRQIIRTVSDWYVATDEAATALNRPYAYRKGACPYRHVASTPARSRWKVGSIQRYRYGCGGWPTAASNANWIPLPLAQRNWKSANWTAIKPCRHSGRSGTFAARAACS
jgi:hypothetical protein